VASAIEDYQKFLRTEGRAPRTLAKYAKVFGRLRDLAERRRVRTLSEVTLKFLDAYRAERAEAGAARKTVYTETVVLRQLVNFALSRGLLATDPLQGLKLKKPKPAPQPCWTPAEVERILAASPEPERSVFLTLAETGLRIGELQHLTWEDIDLGRNVLHVRPKDGWRPKTGDQRAIPMTARVRSVLERLPRRGRWVFCARPSGKYPRGDHPVSERRLLAALKRVLGAVGLEGHLHTFRHAFISHALTQGIPEAIVRQWVGHVDAEVLKLYTHIADAASQAAMQRLEGSGKKGLQPGGTTDGQQEPVRDSAQPQHKDKEQRDDGSAK
jgi:integrase